MGNYNIQNIQKNIEEWVATNFNSNFTFRKYQLESIVYIIKSILLDNRQTQLIEAPTGSGKSLICVIAAGVLSTYYKKTCYILCSDLFLWRQYTNVIDNYKLKDFGYLKGLSNYKCKINKQEVKNGKCKLDKIPYSSLKNPEWCKRHFYTCVRRCPYMIDRFKAENSKVTLMTYQLWLYHMNLVNKNEANITFDKRDVIFCDECHNIPNIIQSFCTPIFRGPDDIERFLELLDYAEECNIEINNQDFIINNLIKEDAFKKDLTNIPISFNELYDVKEIKDLLYYVYRSLCVVNENYNTKDIYDLLEILISIISLGFCTFEQIEEEVKQKSSETKGSLNLTLTRLNANKNWLTSYYTYLRDFYNFIKTCGIEYLVMEDTTNENKNKEFSFSCAKEDYLCYNYLLKFSKYQIMLSATVGMHEAYDKNIGIQYTEQKISTLSKIPSTFNFDRSPIYYIPNYKMGNSTKDRDFPMIRELCYKIINANNCRGLIHTGSYQNALMLYSNAPLNIKQRMILYNGSKQKEENIQNFKYSSNAILVGPTLMEGIDLPDDLCRFNIIMKVPYPNITGKLIKQKIELFPLWYDTTTSNNIIQCVGRGVRNENDYCVTYILDGCFSWLYQKTKEQYPKDFQQRLIYLTA